MTLRLVICAIALLGCQLAAGISPSAANPPIIDEQPIGRVATEGSPVALSFLAHGTGTLTYQWWKGTTALTNNARITSVTNAVLSIVPCLTNDIGDYSAVVTLSGSAVTSSIVSLVISQMVVGLTSTGTGAVVSVIGQPGDVYRFEVSTNFFPYTTNGFATNRTGRAQFIDVDPGGGFRRLRVGYERLLPVIYPPVPNDTQSVLRAYGKLSQGWRFEATTDYLQWTNLATITNTTGWVKFTDTNAPQFATRFYRISPP